MDLTTLGILQKENVMTRITAKLLAILSLVAIGYGVPSTASGREWNVNGRQVTGEFVGVEGDRVRMRLANGRFMVVKLDKLAADDLEHVRAMLEIHKLAAPAIEPESTHGISAGDRMIVNQLAETHAIHQAQWEVQQSRMLGMEVWIVQLYHRTQGPHWVSVMAHNNVQAMAMGASMHPQSRPVSVKKIW